MDAVEPQPSTAPPAHTSPRPAHRNAPLRAAASPKSAAWDGRFKRISPRSVAATTASSAKDPAAPPKMATRATRKASVTGRPLVPVTERKPQEEKMYARGGKDSDTPKVDITPDGGSAGREGRHFTVSNVGNNGRIYLRPTVRPAHQRYPQPTFTFPITPPGTAGLDALGLDKQQAMGEGSSELHASIWTPTPGASPTTPTPQYFPDVRDTTIRPTAHRRAMSDSTIQDVGVAKESDTGAFKIVISKPGDERRPHTMEDLDGNAVPLIDISIPSWKLGTPRFSVRGTPLIRGSSYAPTEDIRSSSVSMMDPSPRETHHSFLRLRPERPSGLAIPQIRFSRAGQDTPLGFPSPSLLRPMRATYMTAQIIIEPAMFDALTFKPACDDRTIVRLASTGAVTAATPPRLVAEITSPSFLDYELISDFFLTFRGFLEPADLLRMLIARLRWALARSDETGTVVRVRTFVAIRHWILNYFMDDFVIDYTLRVTFCELLNGFVEELLQDSRTQKLQLKILVELKKCWRRVCAHYWDVPELDDALGPDIAIVPGGIAGHRDPNLDPTFWEREDAAPPQLGDSLFAMPKTTTEPISFYADVSRAGHIGDSAVMEDRPATPEHQVTDDHQEIGPASPPISLTSMNIVSCSFPGMTMRGLNPNPGHPMAAHPISSTSVYNQTGPVATTPKALVGKRVRPTAGHKRKNSQTDSLREHSSDNVSIKDQEFVMTAPFAGSLVRGNLLPPGQAFVDVAPPGTGNQAQRQTTVFQPEKNMLLKERMYPSAMSGHGMKKLIGSVRRALSTRGPAVSPVHGNMHGISALGPRGATVNRVPGTAIVPQGHPGQHGVRPPVRIDLLGAEVAEDFKKAVREEAAAEAERRVFPSPSQNLAVPAEVGMEYSAAHMESSAFASLPQNQALMRTVSDMGITTGSKSIVIVDDTVQFEPSLRQTTLPAVNPSVEAFAETFSPNGADPTPPNTPPAQLTGGTPQRSSYAISQHPQPVESGDALPPFIPDMATLGQGDDSSPDEVLAEPYFSAKEESPRRPVVTGVSFEFPRRHRSTRTHQSLNSILHRRHASFGSNAVPRSMVRSFDATTYSGGSVVDESEAPMPEPLRVLRRRPGGDLRAATNIGELDPAELRKSRSVGSLTTFTDSLRSSFLHSGLRDSFGNPDVATSDFSQGRPEVFSVGQLADKTPKRDLSLFSTHSSKPVMRPSFEAEAQKLAQIPDDEDDGGVESALAKLEGKSFKRVPKLSMDLRRTAVTNDIAPGPENIGVAVGFPEAEGSNSSAQDDFHLTDRAFLTQPDQARESLATDAQTIKTDDTPHRPETGLQSFLSEGSEESYSSIPLLDRGLTDDGRSRATREWTDRSILQGSDDGTPVDDFGDGLQIIDPGDSRHLSFDFIHKTDSMIKIQPGDDAAAQQSEEQSFLNVDSADASDLSSELSVDGLESGNLERGNDFSSRPQLPAHPLGDPTPAAIRASTLPPTPLPKDHDFFSEQGNVPELREDQIWDTKPLPPTPDRTPNAPYHFPTPTSPLDPMGTAEALRGAVNPEIDDSRRYSVHLPFTLAFESEVLAEQFTLIEKDALNEIDWKELIDMQWKHCSSSNSRSWVDFLRNTDARGVEVVIARFNIMVKWAISEVVLTQHIEERARCIIKYIHIAAHCRKYRNFATLAQLTIALSSNEVARLGRTWAMVPASDMDTLRDLETLVTPTRNFYNLRAEMETGTDAGCIPFVGIYTHDLLFNAQRPSEIASSPTTAPLVNFERCRIGAAVVKTLLRLLEASTRFNFQPIEGITERCLWVGALTDDEIRRHSEGLQ